MKINNNIPALLANNNLNKTDNRLTASLEKLSSGYRINKAADDAAGMAISQKMHSQIVGLERASRNSADGVSLIQTAEGALTETENILQRMRELAVQAANGTNTLDDREAMQKEIEALKDEVDRLANETEFNTKKLLDGSCERLSSSNHAGIQVISVSDDVALSTYEVEVTTAATKANLTGGTATAFSGTGGTVGGLEEGKITVNGEVIEVKEGQTLSDVFSAIRDLGSKVGIDVTNSSAVVDGEFSAGDSMVFTSKNYGSSSKIEVTCSNTALSTALGLNGAITTMGQDVKVTPGTGFSSSATAKSDGSKVTISDRSGFEMILETAGAEAGDDANVSILDAGQVTLQVGANEGQEIEITIPAVTCASLNIEYINVNTEEGASSTITTVDDAIKKVSAVRAKLGAYQNRLESAINSLDTSALNMTESVSRIEDVDMAEEMANYTQYQVLTQAGTSMLSQANSRPQQILQLLQG